MIDIIHKNSTLRIARASAQVECQLVTIERVRSNDLPKGNLFDIAKAAALLASKKTAELIPHCHPVSIDGMLIEFQIEKDHIQIDAEGKSIGRTGIEMEVLTAVSIAALTIYDLLKPIDKKMQITNIVLKQKQGGKSDPKYKLPKDTRVAVLVCSDSTAAGDREDKSGKIIKDRLENMGLNVVDYSIIPDEKDAIQKAIKAWAQDEIPFVFTTGGTGLGPRDNTVDSVAEILDRQAPGISEAIRSHGQDRTPWAMLSRSVCGIIDKTVVITMPGSSNGAKESLDAILPGVLHAHNMISGGGH